jgi:hypothetical protein
MQTDYVIFFLTALFAVIGAGLFRVGLMNFKGEPSADTRKGWLFVAALCSGWGDDDPLTAKGQRSLAAWVSYVGCANFCVKFRDPRPWLVAQDRGD